MCVQWDAEAGKSAEHGVRSSGFSSQLCPLTKWPLTCHLFLRFLFYHLVMIRTSLKECLSDMMWVNVFGLIKKDVWNLSQHLRITAKQNGGTRLVMSTDWKETSQGINSFGCSPQDSLFPNSEKSWDILTVYYALFSNTPLQLNPSIASSLIFPRTL